MKKILPVLIGISIWLLPAPQGIEPNGWNLLALFIATMVGIVAKPYPMSALSLISLTVAVVTGILSFEEAFSGFSNDVVWLVIFAFFVAKGFVATGLGNRLAYQAMRLLGRNSLGLGYGLVATDFLLAPMIPSVAARTGGIIYPLVRALTQVFTGPSHDAKMGAYLAITALQGSLITSAMFLTSMAGNPLIAGLAQAQGIQITWGSWILASFLPGVISLLTIPYILYRLAPPHTRKTPHARALAEEHLEKMGPMKRAEWVMACSFFLLLTLWIIGPYIKMKATVAAMIGLAILLLTGILKWKDILEEQPAWDTFVWFATLVTLSGFLNQFGLTAWFGHQVLGFVGGFEWLFGFIAVSLIYFYSHYFFASNVAHIGALYTPILIVAIALGTPPMLAALVLAFFSSLFGGLTHYASSPAPILFGASLMSVSQWWKLGLITSVINILIWLIFGGLWWKLWGFW